MKNKPRLLKTNERIVLFISIFLLVLPVLLPVGRAGLYALGKDFITSGKYAEAEDTFRSLDDYRQAKLYRAYCEAVQAFGEGGDEQTRAAHELIPYRTPFEDDRILNIGGY